MINKTIIKRKKQDGRSSDFSLQWLVKNHGQKWETWRQLAEDWMINQDTGVAAKLESLRNFFDIYLTSSVPFTSDVISFFVGKRGWQASTDEFKRIVLEKTNKGANQGIITILNYATQFIDWVLDKHFSQKDDHGKLVHLYANPFEKVKVTFSNNETVRNPLPYRYICDLRHILCPKSSGTSQIGSGHNSSQVKV